MLDQEIGYLDGKFTVTESRPSTIAEIVALIGEDAVVEEAVDNLDYRNKRPRVYRRVSEAIKGEFPKIVKETKKNKDGTDKQVFESDQDHLRAALAGRDDGTAPLANAQERLAELFTQHGTAEPLYVKGERVAGGSGKLAKGDLEIVNGWFAEGDDVVEKKIEIIEGQPYGIKIARDSDGNATPESVTRGLMALNKAIKEQVKKQSMSLLAGV